MDWTGRGGTESSLNVKTRDRVRLPSQSYSQCSPDTLPYDTSICLQTSRGLHYSYAEIADMDSSICSTVVAVEGRPLL
ncbi:hypothetical protein TNCV_4314491 [Trichonephila clavipes]|nr:hypothetical protein TNCV_4314491 [Trichonephila clavipes]